MARGNAGIIFMLYQHDGASCSSCGEVVRASTFFGAVVISLGSIIPDICDRFTCCPTLCYEAAALCTKDTLPVLMQRPLHALCMCLLYHPDHTFPSQSSLWRSRKHLSISTVVCLRCYLL